MSGDATPPWPSMEFDRRALAVLTRLLDAETDERAARLADLQRSDPALAERVQRMLAASADDGSTQALAAPAATGWRALAAAGSAQGAGPAAHVAGELIAGYRLLRPLGQGGMSRVWLAERADGVLKRQVAIKLPLAAQLTAVLADRFARERDVLAALNHPHIARLIDAGVSAEGQPFIVLEHVDGVSISEHAATLDQDARLQLFLQVLDAVEHAHRHLTVHRDLKPSNILVDRQGQVKLLDFGIAKLLAPPPDALALTQDASAVLTPRYAAPEQVSGAAVSTATDQYAAAVVLYELLTGRLPYADDNTPPVSLAAMLHAVTQTLPLPPRLGTDLDTVLLKALNKSPAERYASVERFGDDLRRVLAHQPIVARRVPWWQRMALLLRRHPRVGAAGALAGGLLLAAAGVAWQQHQASREQQARADRVRDFVYSMVADAEPLEGKTEVTGNDLLDAAVIRARSEFTADPMLRGQLLAELGRVYYRMQREDRAIATLDEALQLLAANEQPGDGAVNRARAILAAALVTRDVDRARRLAEQSLAACTTPDVSCAEARGWAHYALHVAANRRGALAESLAQARLQVQAFEQVYGPNGLNLLPALDGLVVAARGQQKLHEAAAAIERAQAIALGQPLRAGLRARLNLLQATIDIDLGRPARARDRLASLAQVPVVGMQPSIAWRWLAQAELGLGRPQAALAAAEQARQTASDNLLRALAELSWAEAASRLGRHTEADAAAEAGRRGLEGSGAHPQSDWALRARRQAAELALRRGRGEDALVPLRELVADHGRLPTPLNVEWGLALDALGCAAAVSGDVAAGKAHHAVAAERYAVLLDPDHPLRLRNAWLQQPADAAWARWRERLAADSPWRASAPVDCRGLI